MPDNRKPGAALKLVDSKGRKRTGKQAELTVEARMNETSAMGLALAGLTRTEIATALGVDNSTVTRYLDRVLSESAAQRKDREQLIEMEALRLDHLASRAWTRAEQGDTGAAYLVLKIGEQRAKLLGLYAPSRTEVSGPEGGPIEVSMSARAALAAQLGIKLEDDG